MFYNLGELRVAVDGLVNKYKSQGVKAVSAALDMKAVSASSGGGFGPGGVGRSGTPQIGGGAKAKEALWQRLASCMDQLHSIVVAVWLLQRVLSKKRDLFTHVLLLDEVMKVSVKKQIYASFWFTLCVLCTCFSIFYFLYVVCISTAH